MTRDNRLKNIFARPYRYILDEDGMTPRPAKTTKEWGDWMQLDKRVLQQTDLGFCRVSTVFLGLDHNFSRIGKPVLWETMVFGGPYDQYQYRATSWVRAAAMHRRAIKWMTDIQRRTAPEKMGELTALGMGVRHEPPL